MRDPVSGDPVTFTHRLSERPAHATGPVWTGRPDRHVRGQARWATVTPVTPGPLKPPRGQAILPGLAPDPPTAHGQRLLPGLAGMTGAQHAAAGARATGTRSDPAAADGDPELDRVASGRARWRGSVHPPCDPYAEYAMTGPIATGDTASMLRTCQTTRNADCAWIPHAPPWPRTRAQLSHFCTSLLVEPTGAGVDAIALSPDQAAGHR